VPQRASSSAHILNPPILLAMASLSTSAACVAPLPTLAGGRSNTQLACGLRAPLQNVLRRASESAQGHARRPVAARASVA